MFDQIGSVYYMDHYEIFVVVEDHRGLFYMCPSNSSTNSQATPSKVIDQEPKATPYRFGLTPLAQFPNGQTSILSSHLGI